MAKQLKEGYLFQKKTIIFVLKILDFLFFSLKRKFSDNNLINEKNNFNTILISNLGHLGDVLLSLKTVQYIKKINPKFKILFLTGSCNMDLLKLNPYIDKIIIYDHFFLNRNSNFLKRIYIHLKTFSKSLFLIRKEKIDLSFDLRAYFPNSHIITFLGGIKYRVGFKTSGFGFLLTEWVEWEEGKHEIEHNFDIVKKILKDKDKWISEKIDLNYILPTNKVDFFQKYGLRPQEYIILNIFSGDKRKNINNESWMKLIKYLSLNYKIILTGIKKDKQKLDFFVINKNIYNLAGETSIEELAMLIKNSKFVISSDSFCAHLAGCLDTFVFVCYHGSNDYKQWLPLGKHYVIKKNIDCSPCFFNKKCNNECANIDIFSEFKLNEKFL